MADQVSFFNRQEEAKKRQAIERRRVLAQRLSAQSQQTPNEVVSGIVVKKSPIDGLAKALMQGYAGYQEGKANREEADLDAQKNAQYEALLSGGSPELMRLAQLNPELALKTYADDIKRTNEMKNAEWMGISPEEKGRMERQGAYGGAIKEGAAFGGFDAYGRPVAQPVMMGGQTMDAYRMGLEGQKADISERTKASYDVMQPQQVLNPATGQYETRAMTRADAAAMASGAPSRNYIMTQAAQRGINPAFADALYGTETNYGQNMGPSSAGAIGPLQTMPQTLQDPGFGVQPARDNSIDEQTRVGLDYMAAMKRRYNNNPIDAAVAYNWGPGNADKWIQSGRDPNALPAETRDYVQKIMQGMQQAPQMPGYQVKGEPSGGQKQIDDLFAKEVYTPYKIGGFADAQKQIGQVGGVLEDLRTKNVTGGSIGYQPNWLKAMTNPQALQTQENIEQVVQRDLRQTLGAQFTEKEGERLISRAYNPKLDEKYNIERVQALQQAMVEAAKAKQDAIEYFDKNGTLAGWQGTMPSISSIESRFDELANSGGSQNTGDPLDQEIMQLEKELGLR